MKKLIELIRAKDLSRRKALILKDAEEVVKVLDFDGNLYIALYGIPILPMPSGMTTEDVMTNLQEIRSYYIKVKNKELE